jgi:septal ring factor EnvC (AmiA/AmiB activator)
MATGLFSVLRLVPWGEVIRNAPRVAAGAKSLWDKVSGRPAPPLPSVDDKVQDQLQAEAHAIARLRAELQATETAVSELQAQMLAATELINDLADQNAQLVQGVETLRRRLAWLAMATAVLGAVAVALLLAR